VARPDGANLMRGELQGDEPRGLGESLAEQFLARGAGAVLES
jgi:hypothetical protein